MEQLSMSRTASLSANSSFDSSSSMYGKRTVEMYSAENCEFMQGLCRDWRIKSTLILTFSILSFLSTAAFPCEQTRNGVMCLSVAEMHAVMDIWFKLLWKAW
jgi:hypothetical protein